MYSTLAPCGGITYPSARKPEARNGGLNGGLRVSQWGRLLRPEYMVGFRLLDLGRRLSPSPQEKWSIRNDYHLPSISNVDILTGGCGIRGSAR